MSAYKNLAMKMAQSKYAQHNQNARHVPQGTARNALSSLYGENATTTRNALRSLYGEGRNPMIHNMASYGRRR